MKSVKTLIDEATKSRSLEAVARDLGLRANHLGEYARGARPVPAHAVAKLIAYVDGESTAKEWLYKTMVLGEKISEGFKSLLRRGMAVCSRAYVLA